MLRHLIPLLCLLPTQALAHEGYIPGDIFVTRNAREEDNSSPGYWNHVGVYAGNRLVDKQWVDGVVEAQRDPGKVIFTPLRIFIERYPQIRLLRLRANAHVDGPKMADAAYRLVGTPYAKLSSACRGGMCRPEWGSNCVAVERRAFLEVFRRDPGWRIPDEVLGDPVFWIVFGKG